ncbi:hypothetical protein [Bacillus mycoides]|uniref:hypothetical protein n=1 Tax=Bacillus mycoides TaxID=1405 RepID=UPI003A7FC989
MEENKEVNLTKEDDLDFDIVAKVEKKLGLDPEGGLYYIEGTVTLSQIFIRKNAGTNIAPSCGYKIAEIARDKDGNFLYDEEEIIEYDENNQKIVKVDDEGNEIKNIKKTPVLGRRFLMTKEEAVNLVARYGVQNAYIVTRDREKKDKATGEVLVVDTITYLMPHPARLEAFTQDDRLINVYKYDENGRYAKPLELVITKEECTHPLWRLIEDDYEKRLKNNNRKKGGKSRQQDHSRSVNMLKQTLQKSSFMSNPFAK